MDYCKIKAVAMTVIGARTPDSVKEVDNLAVNELLDEGWRIIMFIPHYSAKHDTTSVTAIMGLPKTDADQESETEIGNVREAGWRGHHDN